MFERSLIIYAVYFCVGVSQGLVIHHMSVIRDYIMQGYKKISEVSREWGISERRINTLCLEGRIEGAEKFGNVWAIPYDAVKPKDERVRSGKYVKQDIK